MGLQGRIHYISHSIDLKCLTTDNGTLQKYILFLFLHTNINKYIFMSVFLETKFSFDNNLLHFLLFIPLILDPSICWDFSEFALSSLPNMGLG